MSNKVRVAARQVNVTPVILGAVTEALYKAWKMQVLSAAARWRYCFASFEVILRERCGKKEFNRGVRKGFAEFD
jgi:hypothetical protein